LPQKNKNKEEAMRPEEITRKSPLEGVTSEHNDPRTCCCIFARSRTSEPEYRRLIDAAGRRKEKETDLLERQSEGLQ
jgi:hypothetical protein